MTSPTRVPTPADRLGGWARWLPILDWGRRYDRNTLASDALAAAIVTLMLIPQSLAYATLAGLPAEVGLYASIAPLLLYALFGTSRVLAVGPVAVVSLMTATAIAPHAAAGTAAYLNAALVLALLSGGVLVLMGLLRLGALAQFLSHPVMAGFITASAVLIAIGQLPALLGLKVTGDGAIARLLDLLSHLDRIHPATAVMGALTLLFLFWARRGLKPLLVRLGLSPRAADLLARAGPVVGIAATAAVTALAGLHTQGVAIVGTVPQGLPSPSLPAFDLALWQQLALPALLIGVVGFVESVSVGQTLASRRRQRIDPDRELVALGASNLGAAFTSGMPVTGGFARSVVNFDAGAQTPAAGVFTAAGIALAAWLLTPALYFIPQATLAATIVVAVVSLVDVSVFRRTWAYSKADFASAAVTVVFTLVEGVEAGLIAGVALSLLLYLHRTSRPHIAEVGRVPGTEHYRNVERHAVQTSPQVLGLRVDESLYFANVRALEDRVHAEVAARPDLRHVVLQCSAVNTIDASALETLEALDARLRDAGLVLHFSEVKGPVMDRLQTTPLLAHLRGQVFRSHHDALRALDPGFDASGPGIAEPDAQRRS
jgi:SulP family sulfate permease